MSKSLTLAGGAVAIAVTVSFAALTMHADTEKEARETIEKKIDRVEAVVTDGLRELRQDVKELLRR